MTLGVNKGVTTIETNILTRTIGNENGMWYSSEITGAVYTAVLPLLRFITNDMQKETSEKNQSNGSFQFANHAMTQSTTDSSCSVGNT